MTETLHSSHAVALRELWQAELAYGDAVWTAEHRAKLGESEFSPERLRRKRRRRLRAKAPRAV